MAEYISKEDLIKKLQKKLPAPVENLSDYVKYYCYTDTINEVKDTKGIDITNSIGHWDLMVEHHSLYNNPIGKLHCSNCSGTIKTSDYEIFTEFTYCPLCGSKNMK